MDRRIRRAVLAFASLSALSSCTLRARSAHAQWYDPVPLLASMRPSARAALPASAGLARLDTVPLYDLELDANPEAHSFRVREELYYTNTESAALPDLVLRLYANTTQHATQGSVVLPAIRMTRSGCKNESGQEMACTITADSPSVITVRPAQPIAPNGRIRVWFEFDGRLDAIDSSRTNLFAQGMESLSLMARESDPSSASATDYGLLAVGDGIACLAQWYAVLAPRRAHQWVRDDRGTLGDLASDELSHVRARVSFPEGYRTVTTGVTVRESVGASSVAIVNEADAGTSRTVLRNPKRTHEVVAAMVRDFTVLSSRTWITLERRVGDVTVRSHVLPNEQAAGQRVLDAAASALAVYERRFGPYPYADLDVCEAAVIGGAGGVEFAGLVTVASMFYREPTAGNSDGALSSLLRQLMGGSGFDLSNAISSMLEFVTAHEVAHQYWHGLVGSDSRDHPFVDEALAQYSAIIYLEDRYGRERAQRDGDANVKNNYHLMRALGQPDQVVNRPVSTFRSPLAYAGIVYGKAPYFYEAVRRQIGDAAFFAALQRYVRDNAFRIAAPNAIVDALAGGSGMLQGRAASVQAARVRALARRWLDETHGDEDLGRVSLGTLAARMMGETDPARIQQLDAMFSMIERTGLLRSLLGGTSPGGAGAPGGIDLTSLLGGANGGNLNLDALIQNGAGSANGTGDDDALVRALLRAIAGNGGIDLGSLLGGSPAGATQGTRQRSGSGRNGTGHRGVRGTGSTERNELMELLQQFMQ